MLERLSQRKQKLDQRSNGIVPMRFLMCNVPSRPHAPRLEAEESCETTSGDVLSGFGTFATCRAGLTMSVDRGRLEVAGP